MPNRKLIALLGLLIASAATAAPLTSAITYQGQLKLGGSAASGVFYFEFALHATAVDGSEIDRIEIADLPVLAGLINASLDFTAIPYDGSALWLEVSARPGESQGSFTTLVPRQPLNASPYALFALAGNSGPAGPPGPPGLLALPYFGSDASIESVHIDNTHESFGTAVRATATNGGNGVHASASGEFAYGVWGEATGLNSVGVYAENTGGNAMFGRSISGIGVRASTSSGVAAVHGENTGNPSGSGVRGSAWGAQASGVFGINPAGPGVWGRSTDNTGTVGQSTTGFGVYGTTTGAAGSFVAGVYGYSEDTFGVYGQTLDSVGVYGSNVGGAANSYAGFFSGRVAVSGDLNVIGTISKSAGAFRIDHPLDPERRYLSHSFVESPDMKNIYDGIVTLDHNGEASIALPTWFEALNGRVDQDSFRYQLTCIGGYAPVFVADEIRANRFRIGGGTPGLRVSWQVTGIRHDTYAERHRIEVETDKPPDQSEGHLSNEFRDAAVEGRLPLPPAALSSPVPGSDFQ